MRLIDADALSKAFDKSEAIEEIYGSYGLPVISEVIDAAPTIDAEPVRHGKWKPYTVRLTRSVKGGMYEKGLRCNLCNYKDGDYEYAYCPNCGAKMEEEEP